MDITLDID